MRKSNNLKDNLPAIFVFLGLFIYSVFLIFFTTKKIYEAIIISFLIFLCPIILCIFVFIGLNHDKKKDDHFIKKPLDIDKINKYLPNVDIDKFLNDRYNDFLTIQQAYINNDKNKLREMLTDELYNIYIMNIEALNFLKKTIIFKNIKYENSAIVQIKELNGTQCVEIELYISYINYSKRKNKIIKGLFFRHFIEHYSIKFIKKNNPLKKCPNCGSELSDNASQICEFCHNIINRVGDKWVMNEKYSISKYLYTKRT